jgi:hypothetical protein
MSHLLTESKIRLVSLEERASKRVRTRIGARSACLGALHFLPELEADTAARATLMAVVRLLACPPAPSV